MALARRWPAFTLFLALVALAFVHRIAAVKHENFKTCEQSGFCRRNRAYGDQAPETRSPYALSADSINFSNGQLTGSVWKIAGSVQVELPLIIEIQERGVVRVTLDERRRQTGDITLRHDSQVKKARYNEAEDWVILDKPRRDSAAQADLGPRETIITYGNGYKVIIKHSPFSIDFVRDEQIQVKLNADGLINVEHWRAKTDAETSEDETTWWEESFGGNTDSKPRGPESVGLDITFPGYEHVYGIAGHAGPLALKETRGGYGEPYRLYNSDVFEYEMDSPMTLYGSIPFMYAHRKGSTVGVFWLNTAETWIDIVKKRETANALSMGVLGKTDTRTHWFSETGLLDVFVFMGPTPKDVLHQYTSLTGYTQLPQEFAIAYHQCRWNYVTDEDVKDVDTKMSRFHVPYDVIWLDIEYTDGKKYFTWDPDTFADPLGMQKQLDASQRKLVAIIDPHIKNEANYAVSEALKSQNLAVKNKDNVIYEGWCWPGSSHWVDCFNVAARKWWSSLYKYKNFAGSAHNLFIWNDMNEPSVFNGPETTMPKDNIHAGMWEHRDVHNVNGLTFHNATYEAMKQRDSPSKRPFVLTRSYFAGSQRLGPMWTGDNQAEWSHLAASLPMVLSMNIAGYPFAGADVGGFFGNPSKELLTRWYQAGAFYPFFRGHAHIDTRRREPYLVGDPYREIITQALRLRYTLLPSWYTAFHEASTTGAPIIRPEYYVNPDDETGFDIEDQFYLGSTGLLIKPVVTEGATSVDVHLTRDMNYFDYFTFQRYIGGAALAHIAAPLDKVPILMQEGHIFPRKDRPRKSSGLMKWDPYTLVVVLNAQGTAQGELYVDDGESFDYQSGALIHCDFQFENGRLSSVLRPQNGKGGAFVKSMAAVTVEKVVLVNAAMGSKSAKVTGGDGKSRNVEVDFHAATSDTASWAIVKNPAVSISQDWTITLEE